MGVTFQNHRIEMVFVIPSHLDDKIEQLERKFGKLNILEREAMRLMVRYADPYGYIANRQSDRWTKARVKHGIKLF